MSFLLDTNICSAHLKRPAGLTHRFVQHSGRLFIPTIVLGELYAWAYHRPNPASLIDKIENDLMSDVVVLDYEQEPRTFSDHCGQPQGMRRSIT